jgi:hypothetical protein
VHDLSYEEMKKNVGKYFADIKFGATIVDFGSQDVNGTYKALISPKWKYVGIDLFPGKNVDVKMASEFDSGLKAGYADGLICGQVLEHCRDPFRLAAEMARITRPGGWLLITAPFMFMVHSHPIDCWRFLPDGMKILFDRAGVQCWSAYIRETDCWYIGKKKGEA